MPVIAAGRVLPRMATPDGPGAGTTPAPVNPIDRRDTSELGQLRRRIWESGDGLRHLAETGITDPTAVADAYRAVDLAYSDLMSHLVLVEVQA